MSRLQKINRYTTVPNSLLNNENISFRAKGVWAFINSKPEGWDFSTSRIAAQTKEGEKAIRTALQELEEAGYLQRELKMKNNGQLDGYSYILTDEPFNFDLIEDKDVSTVGLKTTDGFSTDGKQADEVIKKEQERNSNTTTSTTSKKEKEADENFLDWTPGEMTSQTLNRCCPDMTTEDIEIELTKFKLYHQSSWPANPDLKFIDWCQRSNHTYRELKVKDDAITKKKERVDDYHAAKMEKIEKIRTQEYKKPEWKKARELEENYNQALEEESTEEYLARIEAEKQEIKLPEETKTPEQEAEEYRVAKQRQDKILAEFQARGGLKGVLRQVAEVAQEYKDEERKSVFDPEEIARKRDQVLREHGFI